jgi:hypothetical protein
MPINSFGAAMRELARQIRLQFADSPALYVSWTWERQRGPGSEPYSIAFSESSYFADSAASDSPLWSGHIGREVELVTASTKLTAERSGPTDCHVFLAIVSLC